LEKALSFRALNSSFFCVPTVRSRCFEPRHLG